MEILSATEDGIRYLGFVGAFDTPEVDAFQAHVDSAIDEQVFRIVINLGQMTFINSTALGALIRVQKRLNQYGGDLALAEPSSFAVGVFRTLGIDRKIRCFPAEQEAVEYIKTVGSEGVGVDGEQQVSFSFVDPAQTAVAGEGPRVGLLKKIGEAGITFQWENLDALDIDKMFVVGAPVRLRFQLPLYHETHMFTPDASVVGSSITAGNRVTVQVKFANLKDVERRAIQQYVRDLRYLKGELSS
jgi:stage II sporulation protein AA (anti-sigma F factor antagonist)